jgi:hypothetical protein
MRASKLIVISTAAVFIGGTSLAIGANPQSGSSMHGSTNKGAVINKGALHGADLGGIRSHEKSGPFARATSQEMEAGLNTQEHARLRDMVRNMPRISNVGTDIRINAIVPKSVREAAAPLPPEVQHMYPRFRQGRAFVHRDHIVIVNPLTSRIVAIVQA